MSQCEATASTPGRDNFGQRCRRKAVTGSKSCVMHGGKKTTTTPDAVRQRRDRPANTCTAHRTDGSPCRAYAIRGGSVCKRHGGQFPNVRKAAANRMLALLAPSVFQLKEIIEKDDTSDSDRLRAISMVLDRTGLGPRSELSLEVKKYEQVMTDIYRVVPDEDGAYSVTDVEDRVTLQLPSGTIGDDLSLSDQEDGSIPQPVILNDYRLPGARVNPPRLLR